MTGGAGFIGSHLADLLLARGYEVTILDNLEPPTHLRGKPPWLNPEAEFIPGDVRNESDLRHSLEGVRFVFHLAAFGGFTPESTKYFDVNTLGTARLFQEIASGPHSIEKVVVASSQAVYGEGAYHCRRDGAIFPGPRPPSRLQEKRWELSCPECGENLQASLTPEAKPRGAETPYALSKEFEERLALACGNEMGIPVAALRYGVTYGPRQSIFNPYTGVVSIFSTQILNDLAPVVYEDGEQTRDFVYVKDVAEASLFVMENQKAGHPIFNVGTGRATTLRALARELARIFGKRIEPKIPGEFRLGDVRHIVLDPGKLRQIGFEAATPLSEGLKFFAEWMRAQGPVEEYFTEAHAQLRSSGIVYG